MFPMLASYDAGTRTIREAIADRRADLKPSRKIRDEFDFDEGRFDDPDDDDDDDRQDEGGDSSSKSDGANQSKAVQGGGDWERHDEDSAWYRIHVEVRKKFFGATNEDLPLGGPSHEELDTVRVTHMRGPIGVSGHTPAQESLTQSTPTVGDRCLPDRGRYMFKPNGSYP